MLKPFQYTGGAVQQNPQLPQVAGQEQNTGPQTMLSGLSGLVDQYQNTGETPASGETPTPGAGWMANLFGGGGEAAAGGGEAAAGSSNVSAMANPWTALAAVIVANELFARKEGNRDKNPIGYASDLGTGNVLNQDIEGRYLPLLGIKEGGKTSKIASTLLNPGGKLGKFVKKIF